LRPPYGKLCERRKAKLLKCTFYAKNFVRKLFRFVFSNLAHFTREMCAAAKNCKKTIKTLYLRGSRSFKIIDVD